ncbi:hypothetical protein Aab01nite_63400 [Paractinoplanes abujensis]|uniref:WCX domain-containing protein n=1 Tax=Paractinoplanes abujensis TaxID=882441 RepID=A0A7W7CTL4_9ACTN|nr:hypothetical protein [Actinoplanes abujensis]MBB4692751.1 hypothetical protein [Actinoplanes abujensis]GID22750.1 hypothetical protein Aab01nite_63400 [Actinoplanes abujensis]
MARGVGTATWRYRARVRVETPAEYVRARMPVPVDVRPLGRRVGGELVQNRPDYRCESSPGADDPNRPAAYLGRLGAGFTVVDGPELVEAVARLADRCRRAATGGQR